MQGRGTHSATIRGFRRQRTRWACVLHLHLRGLFAGYITLLEVSRQPEKVDNARTRRQGTCQEAEDDDLHKTEDEVSI